MLRRLISYVRAHHVALLALFLAMGGTSYAAITLPAGSVGTTQLRNHAVTLAKINSGTVRSLRGQTGAQGPQGQQGPTGPQGPQGPAGVNGSPAASMLTGEGNTVPTFAGTAFAEPVGQTASVTTTELSHDELSPNTSVIAKNLAVRLPVDPPAAGSSYTFAIRVNGTDTTVQCTIPAGQSTCNSGAATAPIPPASEIVLAMTGTGSVDGVERLFQFGWQATTP